MRVCIRKQKQQQLHEIRGQEEYQIYKDFSEGVDPEQASSHIGTISSSSKSIYSVSRYADEIFANTTINGCHKIKIKVDTGADTCILTENQMLLLPFKPRIKKTNTILKGYEGLRITNTGATDLKLTYKNKTITTSFDIVNTPLGPPSILGCRQAQALGIISFNLNEIKRQSTAGRETINKKKLLEKFKTCFNKIGCFPGKKYHIELTGNPKPVIHPPRPVPIHILPIYKRLSVSGITILSLLRTNPSSRMRSHLKVQYFQGVVGHCFLYSGHLDGLRGNTTTQT